MTNPERAARAAVALEAFTALDFPAYANEPVDTRAADLITDLLHLVELHHPHHPMVIAQRGIAGYVTEVFQG